MSFERPQEYLDTLTDDYVRQVIETNQYYASISSEPAARIHESRLEVFIPEAIKRGIAVAALTSMESS